MKWTVMIPIHASTIVEVEADTKEEAIQKGYEEAAPSLCHQCSHEVQIDCLNDDEGVADAWESE